MIAHYILSYLKHVTPGKDKKTELSIIITIVLGVISSVIGESFLAYFIFLTLKDFYAYPVVLASVSTAGVFCFQAMLLFYYSYYRLQKSTQISFLGKEYSDVKKVTHAFIEGFQKKRL